MQAPAPAIPLLSLQPTRRTPQRAACGCLPWRPARQCTPAPHAQRAAWPAGRRGRRCMVGANDSQSAGAGRGGQHSTPQGLGEAAERPGCCVRLGMRSACAALPRPTHLRPVLPLKVGRLQRLWQRKTVVDGDELVGGSVEEGAGSGGLAGGRARAADQHVARVAVGVKEADVKDADALHVAHAAVGRWGWRGGREGRFEGLRSTLHRKLAAGGRCRQAAGLSRPLSPRRLPPAPLLAPPPT